MSDLMTMTDVAETLQVARRSVIRWRDNGTLPAPVKIGRLIRWRRDDLEKWIEGGCIPCYKTQRPGA